MTHKSDGFIENLMKVPVPLKQFLISIDREHMFRARDLNARLVLPVIDANLKMFYDKCWQVTSRICSES